MKLTDAHWTLLYAASRGQPVYPTLTSTRHERASLTKMRRTLAQHHLVDPKTGEITDIGKRVLEERAAEGKGEPQPEPSAGGPQGALPLEAAAPAPAHAPAPAPDAPGVSRQLLEVLKRIPASELHEWDREFMAAYQAELGIGMHGEGALGLANLETEKEFGPRPASISYSLLQIQPPSQAPQKPTPPPNPPEYPLGQALADLHAFCTAASMHCGTAAFAASAVRLFLGHFERYNIPVTYPGNPDRHEQALLRLCTAKHPEIPQTARLGPKQRRFLCGNYQAIIVLLVSDDPFYERLWGLYGKPEMGPLVEEALKDCTMGRLRAVKE